MFRTLVLTLRIPFSIFLLPLLIINLILGYICGACLCIFRFILFCLVITLYPFVLSFNILSNNIDGITEYNKLLSLKKLTNSFKESFTKMIEKFETYETINWLKKWAFVISEDSEDNDFGTYIFHLLSNLFFLFCLYLLVLIYLLIFLQLLKLIFGVDL